ncbi:MAG: DUF2703 domain-containing protein [Deltaproteobacteria bacterium]|nr:DUF2703 domain-containing protein [Deltaproteobacteria bacterium]
MEAIRKVLEEKKISGSIEEILITTEEEAWRNNFLGSPTIKINGTDLEPSARNLSQTGLG